MADHDQSIGWAIVEMLGHRRVAGYVQETTVAGAGFLRLDMPESETHPAQTQLISPGSVYALHPVDEQTARTAAAAWRPAPVHRWELPAAPSRPQPRIGDPDDDEPDDPWGTPL